MTEALQPTIDGDEIDHWEVVGTRPPVAEGDTCDKCGRRVPHAKKKASPKTRVSSIRVPLDDADTFDELVDAASEHLGLKSRPHHKYFTMVAGLVLVLQAPAGVMDES